MKLNDLNIMVEGKGQAIILLHGWGQSSKMMEPIFDYFKKEYKVCNLDLPGFGKSKELNSSCGVYDYVLLIKEIVQKYELYNPIIIAHSFGGRIAFHYAAIFPCKYLIITGGAGILPKRGLDYYFKIYLYKGLRNIGIPTTMGSSDYKKANGNMRRTLVNIVNEDASKVIPDIKCNMLLIWGEDDKQTPVWMAKKIVSLNSNATLLIFKKDDHFAYYHQMHRFIKVCECIIKDGE